MTDDKLHWDNIYASKQPHQVSWTQAVPQTSLNLIAGFGLDKNAAIIDIGGGDSNLVDHLLLQGYQNITVLDISATALDNAKQRLGAKANSVQWIVSDVTLFKPDRAYDVWHDRAAFHFLTTDEQVAAYAALARRAVAQYMVIGTFSTSGPQKCSGLNIRQYNPDALQQPFADAFTKLDCFTEDHKTPFDTYQNFLFCSFERIESESNIG